MDLNIQLEALIPKVDELDTTSLTAVISNIEKLLQKTKDLLLDRTQNLSPPPPPAIAEPQIDIPKLFEYEDDFLGKTLMKEVQLHLDMLHFTPQGVNQPGIYLYGDSKYVYNKASATVIPTPISDSACISKVLDIVNGKLGTAFNSVLINKYSGINNYLDWHQDDEKCLDKNSSIATLSIGARRRLQLSSSNEKKKAVCESLLMHNSLFVMDPILQKEYYHKLAPGRKSCGNTERGQRHSLTFRRIIVSPTSTTNIYDPPTPQGIHKKLPYIFRI